MPIEPVWITGIGASTPLGDGFDAIAESLLAGRSGIDVARGFDVAQHPSQIAAQVERVPCPAGYEAAEFARRPRLEQLVLWCASSALDDAGLRGCKAETRVGIVLGLGAEWMLLWENDVHAGGTRVYEPERDVEPLVAIAQRELELKGPTLVFSAACASGNHSLDVARRWLRMGLVDVCLAGACDMAVTPLSLASFGNLRALSRRNDAPQAASRPFDRQRDGFVLGEGGAVFVLERASTGRKRSARAYAEVAGCGASSDAHHPVIPSPDPAHAAAAMRQALEDAGVVPAEIDYINAHATSTPVGDATEARVLQDVLGEATRHVPVSSTKGMTGHMLTAAGAVEAIACLAAIDRGALPPTVNLDEPDSECALCHVANQARPQKTRVAVSNSFGFGGSNTCLVLRAV